MHKTNRLTIEVVFADAVLLVLQLLLGKVAVEQRVAQVGSAALVRTPLSLHALTDVAVEQQPECYHLRWLNERITEAVRPKNNIEILTIRLQIEIERCL